MTDIWVTMVKTRREPISSLTPPNPPNLRKAIQTSATSSCEEVKSEVTCYRNATAVRRQLSKLIIDQPLIRGTNEKKSQASMAEQMQELEPGSDPIQHRTRIAKRPTSVYIRRHHLCRYNSRLRSKERYCYQAKNPDSWQIVRIQVIAILYR